MPIEIRRFGVGNRRASGPAGTSGVTSQVIHGDGRGVIAELAFARGARMEPHTNPNTTYLVVIEGGGWVLVGDEKARIAAGEAAVWPAHVLHAAWTEHSPMRAFVVEFAGADDAEIRGILEGRARSLGSGDPAPPAEPAEPAEGSLAEREIDPAHDPASGEPL